MAVKIVEVKSFDDNGVTFGDLEVDEFFLNEDGEVSQKYKITEGDGWNTVYWSSDGTVYFMNFPSNGRVTRIDVEIRWCRR